MTDTPSPSPQSAADHDDDLEFIHRELVGNVAEEVVVRHTKHAVVIYEADGLTVLSVTYKPVPLGEIA